MVRLDEEENEREFPEEIEKDHHNSNLSIISKDGIISYSQSRRDSQLKEIHNKIKKRRKADEEFESLTEKYYQLVEYWESLYIHNYPSYTEFMEDHFEESKEELDQGSPLEFCETLEYNLQGLLESEVPNKVKFQELKTLIRDCRNKEILEQEKEINKQQRVEDLCEAIEVFASSHKIPIPSSANSIEDLKIIKEIINKMIKEPKYYWIKEEVNQIFPHL